MVPPHLDPRVVLRRVDQEATDLGEGEEHRLFKVLEIPSVNTPQMSPQLAQEHAALLRLSRSDDLDVMSCVCKQSRLLSNDLMLLQVNKALRRHHIGPLVYRMQAIDTGRESINHRGMWMMSCIAAYPQRQRSVETTGCKSLAKLRGYVDTIFGNSKLLPNCPTLSLTAGYDLEGFKLVEHEPRDMRGFRRVPIMEGYCYGEVAGSHVIYLLVVPGQCAICQRAAAEAL